jgi:hypothetical protein
VQICIVILILEHFLAGKKQESLLTFMVEMGYQTDIGRIKVRSKEDIASAAAQTNMNGDIWWTKK